MSSEEEYDAFATNKWAGKVLDNVLNEDKANAEKQQEDIKIDVNQEKHNRPLIDVDTGRDKSRVLFVTTEKDVLLEGSSSQKHYLDMAPQFDEVHIMVFVMSKNPDGPSKRISYNVWVYIVNVFPSWHIPLAAADAARENLIFNDNVRPDIVVGVNPLGAGLAAYLISKSLKRPWQLHITKDVFRRDDKKYSFWSRFLAKIVLKLAVSVRTKTAHIKEVTTKYCRKKCEIKLLPHFYNFTQIKDTEPLLDLHKKYPEYAFIVLAFGPLTADSSLHDAFLATNGLFNHPRVGMVVVGDGPSRNLFEDKIKLLGITKNVAFLSSDSDVNSLMKTSDVLVEMGTDHESEERVMRAAILGLPIVTAITDLRKDLFTDGSSAFLCEKDDSSCFRQKIQKLMNDNSMRKKLIKAAEYVASSRVEENPEDYRRAYRDSIETILVTK